MLQGFLVSAAFLFGKLAGALVQLRGHFGGFFGRTAEHGQRFGKFGNFHGTNLTMGQFKRIDGLLDDWIGGWKSNGWSPIYPSIHSSTNPFCRRSSVV
jgi:hypothetical protein